MYLHTALCICPVNCIIKFDGNLGTLLLVNPRLINHQFFLHYIIKQQVSIITTYL